MRFAIVFATIALIATTASAAARVVATCVNVTPCPVNGALVIGDKTVPIANGIAHVDDLGAQATLSAAGYWMPPQTMVFGSIRVWRTAALHGKFALAEARMRLPKSFAIEIESPPGSTGVTIARNTIDCPVAGDGSWSCAVPAVPLDVVLRARTFTPHYLFNARIPSDLGVVLLRQAASVVVWLDRKTLQAVKVPPRARLLRMTMSVSPTLGTRLDTPVAEAVFNPRGLAQLAPVAPGTYRLEVTAPGFAPATIDRIDVYPHSESVLRPAIRLEPPLTIHFTLRPPRDPHGKPWRLSISRRNEYTSHSTPVAESAANANGSFDLTGQAAGRFDVIVSDAQSNRFAWRELDIRGDSDAHPTIDVGELRVHGKIMAGGDAIAAHLLFGGRSGPEQIKTDSDEKGAFSVTLPHAGKWKLDVDAPSEGILTATSVDLDAKHDSLEIALPNTEVRGWVVGTDGKRLAGARVIAQTDDGVVFRRTNADGSFRFRGLGPGAAKLNASHPQTREVSKYVALNVSDGAHIDNVELALQDVRDLKGFITSQGQPVIGARVTAYGLNGNETARQERAVSGLDGGFDLSFPSAATEIMLTVSAPGRTLQAFSTPPSDQPITFDVAAQGGQLRLRIADGGTRPRVSYSGTIIPLPDLIEWARAQDPAAVNGSQISIANVAPGPYRFCVALKNGDVCRDGVLATGGVLVLSPE